MSVFPGYGACMKSFIIHQFRLMQGMHIWYSMPAQPEYSHGVAGRQTVGFPGIHNAIIPLDVQVEIDRVLLFICKFMRTSMCGIDQIDLDRPDRFGSANWETSPFMYRYPTLDRPGTFGCSV